MSYLEMKSAPLPNMSSGIISFWFRDVSEQQEKPVPAEIWPQGYWTQENADTVMVPPNTQYSIGYDPSFMNKSIFYWNSYGFPIGGQLFGNLFLGPASVWIPNSPPVPLNTMYGVPTGIADTDMSLYGIRVLLAFGDPNIDYNYCTWRADKGSGVMDAVEYFQSVGVAGEGGSVLDWPYPYKPYVKIRAGEPVGDNGKFKVTTFRLNGPTPKGKVPQSFIGIDDRGYIVINLQTNSKAAYKGMAFEQNVVKELWANATYLEIDGPPYSYTQLGFPFPDGHWVIVDGFWNGFEFEHKDVSQEVMGCAPESFVLYGAQTGILDFSFNPPVVQDGGWHHLLFSFDISGSVTTDLTDNANPIIESNCRAWLALDDKNIPGTGLQNRPPVHDGFILPKLRGTHTTQLLDCGPCTTYGRGTLGPNIILPRNAWLHGWNGNPKEGLFHAAPQSHIITDDDNATDNVARAFGGVVGDFDWQDWTGIIWPLYGHGIADGPWQATFDPMHPSPTKDYSAPSYFCSGFSIPVNGHPIGVPVGGNHVRYNTGVEMAELQIWANKTLDTADGAMRRLFISEDGSPVPPSEAELVLGKPDILLHGSGNWKRGKNTGTAGVDEDGNIIGDGQFDPVSAIEAFKPDPKLHG